MKDRPSINHGAYSNLIKFILLKRNVKCPFSSHDAFLLSSRMKNPMEGLL